ncbi:hypothetical protein PHMEG_00013082 [Phytophthora megakarya]|uniref:Uncharacterized protein n=1 Tax=Phytophthora megakarya TaxID=4795 RepID=A0A225W8T3_9STRA|nr:hypothetical protein PHMEG_00013082 [Phytophthora megakarya]
MCRAHSKQFEATKKAESSSTTTTSVNATLTSSDSEFEGAFMVNPLSTWYLESTRSISFSTPTNTVKLESLVDFDGKYFSIP